MPAALMPKFAELCLSGGGRYERVALVTDVRGRDSFDELFKALDEMRQLGCDYKILFIEASVETIVKRYKETRRKHPLDPTGGAIENAVHREKRMLEAMRSRADYIIDTSGTTLGQLQRKLYRLLVADKGERTISVNVMSFGFKYGIPMDADLVFDVRFLPNPFYVAELKDKCGLDAPVSDFIFSHQQANEFMDKLTGMMEFLLPLYVEEGKSSLVIAVGCTGGHHRSVAVAKKLADAITQLGYPVEAGHRDVTKE
jgi:UPF0042 nucleotide-binding protein